MVTFQIVEEIQEIIGNESPDFENTKNLKYMKAVFDETLR